MKHSPMDPSRQPNCDRAMGICSHQRSLMRWLCTCIVSIVTIWSSPNWAMAQGSVSPADVQQAIEDLLQYFRRTQNRQAKDGPVGAWQGHQDQKTGLTSLVVLALLSAGRKPNDTEVARAMDYIRSEPPMQVYEASLQIMAMCLAEPGRDRALIERNVEWLIQAQQADGGWAYRQDRGASDESNTQFAVLALWEASRIGIEIPQPVIQKGRTYWLNKMSPAGTWGYRGDPKPLGSMTCAGIASMLILEDASATQDARAQGNQIQCCTQGAAEAYDLEKSLRWLADNFSVTQNPGSAAWYMYYMYGLERVGRLSGQRFIGQHDWYREGCDAIVGPKNSRLMGVTQGSAGIESAAARAMALLFLSKGKRQVVIGQLQHSTDPQDRDWNRHRKSIQHLTGHIELAWKRDLAWQTIKLQRATLPDLLETPVLFITGSQEFVLSAQQRRMIKDYIDQGGFIFAEACAQEGCDGQAFDVSFRREMEMIFDKPFQKLPPNHPVWSAEARLDPSALPDGFWLYGIEACCKTSIIYSPISLTCRWELSKPYGAKPQYSKAVSSQLDNAVKIGLNVVAYATGRELKDKLEAVQIVQSDMNRQVLDRGTLTLPKLMHSGGGDETPKALSNLVEVFRRETKAMVDPKTPKLSATSTELEKYPLVYIHGRTKFAFSEAEQQGMRNHFINGGMVLGDAICGSEEFTKSMREEFGKLFPDAKWQLLPVDHPLLLKDGPGGYDLRNVSLVDPGRGDVDLAKAKREGPAEIEALEWNDRIIVLFSPNDLSCAMESKHSLQCRGYVREDAFRIGINFLLYSQLH
ncbi:MAG: DUF4159 domain-containing protein [Pirellula sp.]